MNNLPLVSVCMVSYNQEKYIQDALYGVLMQVTSFPIELIVSDDCSTDTTPDILRQYADEYTNVRPIYGRRNVGYPNNQRRSLEAARGKYIALCDADDYWTDPYKLQKQVDYLEAHSDCVICFHNVMNVYEVDTVERSLLNPLDFPTELTLEDMIMRKWFLATNSEVFRREYLLFPEWYDSVLHIDYVISVIVAQYGKLHYMPDVMSVYRHTAQSVSCGHQDGRWGYMLFHSQTMKTILTNLKQSLAPQYQEMLDVRISQYDSDVKRYKREMYFEKHLLARMFRLKTYKRLLKKYLQRKKSCRD